MTGVVGRHREGYEQHGGSAGGAVSVHERDRLFLGAAGAATGFHPGVDGLRVGRRADARRQSAGRGSDRAGTRRVARLPHGARVDPDQTVAHQHWRPGLGITHL